jgi:hypothetical protein
MLHGLCFENAPLLRGIVIGNIDFHGPGLLSFLKNKSLTELKVIHCAVIASLFFDFF